MLFFFGIFNDTARRIGAGNSIEFRPAASSSSLTNFDAVETSDRKATRFRRQEIRPFSRDEYSPIFAVPSPTHATPANVTISLANQRKRANEIGRSTNDYTRAALPKRVA